MKLLKKWLNVFWFGLYEKETFKNLKTEIIATNLFFMRRVSTAFSVIAPLLFFLALFIKILSDAILVYAALSVISLIVLAMCYWILPTRPRSVMPTYYTFFFCLTCLAVVLGTVFQPEMPSVVICVLLAIMPVFILDRPGVIEQIGRAHV